MTLQSTDEYRKAVFIITVTINKMLLFKLIAVSEEYGSNLLDFAEAAFVLLDVLLACYFSAVGHGFPSAVN